MSERDTGEERSAVASVVLSLLLGAVGVVLA